MSKINLNEKWSPCVKCYFQGHNYSANDNSCQSCEYNIAIQLLKCVLSENDYCSLCKYVKPIGGGYVDCSLGEDRCVHHNAFEIDWNAAFKEYEYWFKNRNDEIIYKPNCIN